MTIKVYLKAQKAKLQFFKWRIKTFRNRRSCSTYFDVNKTHWIDPRLIRFSIDSKARNRLEEETSGPVSPVLERGSIVGGDWDLDLIEFESQDVWAAFCHRFKKNGKWSETSFYKRVVNTINGGIRMWGCTTQAEFEQRLVGVDSLFEDIKCNGYLNQDQALKAHSRPIGTEDEIQVHLGRNGEFIFADGRHRLCIAKILELKEIPVKVARRHEKWVGFGREVLSYANNQSTKKIYSKLTHSDLEDIPAVHDEQRLSIIFESLPVRSGLALDIGAHWGCFSFALEELGFDVIAIEYLPINQYFLKKLKKVEQKQLTIFNGNFFDFQSSEVFDVVLALNIFHHFLKTETDYGRLRKLLSRLRMRSMIFESHDPEEAQMENSFKNFSPHEFAQWVAKHAGFSVVKEIGCAQDGRQIFLLK